jgi:hypothetical protein
VQGLSWSEGNADNVVAGQSIKLKLRADDFTTNEVAGVLRVAPPPKGWNLTLAVTAMQIPAMGHVAIAGTPMIPSDADVRDSSVVVECGPPCSPALAFRVVVRE